MHLNIHIKILYSSSFGSCFILLGLLARSQRPHISLDPAFKAPQPHVHATSTSDLIIFKN